MSQPGPLREIGHSVERKDGVAKVTGRAQYLDDLVISGAVYAAIVRSPYAHARILSVERAAAAAVPGVVAALAAADLGALGERPFGTFLKDQCVLARDKARYEGEPVAVVMAEDPATERVRNENIHLEQLLRKAHEEAEKLHQEIQRLKGALEKRPGERDKK